MTRGCPSLDPHETLERRCAKIQAGRRFSQHCTYCLEIAEAAAQVAPKTGAYINKVRSKLVLFFVHFQSSTCIQPEDNVM